MHHPCFFPWAWLYSKCYLLPLESAGDYSVCVKRKIPLAEGNQWLQASTEVCPGIKSSPCSSSGCDKLVEARKAYLNFDWEDFYGSWERCCVREYERRCTKWLFNHSCPQPPSPQRAGSCTPQDNRLKSFPGINKPFQNTKKSEEDVASLVFGLYHFKRDGMTLCQPQVKDRLEFHPCTCGWREKNIQIESSRSQRRKSKPHILSEKAYLLLCVRHFWALYRHPAY